MTIALSPPAERVALTRFLDEQRCSALAIVDGLSEPDLHRSVVPSAWTPLSLIEHLAGAEWHWFERVLAGTPTPSTPDVDPIEPPSSSDVIDSYRAQVARSNEILAGHDLDGAPLGQVQPEMRDEIHTVRDILLHMIEETARHAGHLDIARELIDGRTGLGPR